MDLQINYGDTQSLIKKLEREIARAEEALEAQSFPDMADAFFNFSVTAYHIKDWLISKSGCNEKEVRNFINSVPVISACRDICNSTKHFEITKYKPGEVTVGSTITEISGVVTNEDGGLDVYGKYDLWVDLGNEEVYRVVDFMKNSLEERLKYQAENKI